MKHYVLEYPENGLSAFMDRPEKSTVKPTRIRLVRIEKDNRMEDLQQVENACILFLLSGTLWIECRKYGGFSLSAGQCFLFVRDQLSAVETRDGAELIRLDFHRCVMISSSDIACKSVLRLDIVPEAASVLTINPLIERMLRAIFDMPRLSVNPIYQDGKLGELFMMIVDLYSEREQAMFFRPIIRPLDDFKAFVLANFHRAKTIDEFARLLGMSRTAFIKRFRTMFNCNFGAWRVKQNREMITQAIKNGAHTPGELKLACGFDCDRTFERFCIAVFGRTPTDLIIWMLNN